jgi:signal transduction histidine kinase
MLEFLSGGGEAGALIRAKDWSRTPLGTPETWPQSLRTAIDILLSSRFAMWLGWGPDLLFFYNDAYRPTLGVKHPWAMGQPTRDVWAEIWNESGIRQQAEAVVRDGKSTWDEGLLLFLQRRGFAEETYHTFSYSPLKAESGAITGLLCVVSEETERVIAERRLRTLRELASDLAGSQAEREVLDVFADRIGTNGQDLPFTLTYLFDGPTGAGGADAVLAAATGMTAGHPAAPHRIEMRADAATWPVGEMLRGSEPIVVTDLAARFADLPHGGWELPPREALVVPIARQGGDDVSGDEHARNAGFFVAGLNPFRPLDASYRGFLGLVAGQLAGGIASARGYEAERRRAEALAELDRAKTIFFSNISHEFRTPLTLMLSPVEEVLARPAGALDEEARELLDVAHRNGLRLLKLVNSLLDFSRIEAGRVRATYEPADLAALTAGLASSFRSTMERAGLRFLVTCPELPQPVFVDRDMWEKIVLNLLSNAFKFTLEGEIEVSIHAATGGMAAELRVRDTGTGIPEAELPRLFERFHRIEGARGRTFEGSGIGLALVQELVRLHHGDIRVSSEVDRGTEFVVSIPFGTAHLPQDRIEAPRAVVSSAVGADAFVEEALRWLAEDADSAERDTPERRAATAPRRRIVLADDNADMRTYVARLLGAYHDVEAVPDGLAALSSIRARRADLVLSDVMMPGLDGFGLLREIRADAALRDTPVIMISARAGEEARVEGLDAGADDYLAKPFAARELIARVSANLALAQARREGLEQLRLALAAGELGTFWFDTVARVGGCSERVAAMFGLPADTTTLALDGWTSALHPDDRARVIASFETAARGDAPFREEYRVALPGGELRWLRTEALLRRDANGAPAQLAGVMRDITAQRRLNDMLEARVVERTRELAAANSELMEQIAERERVESTLRRMQRLEAVGQLTSGVAHDFNNLLTVILGSIEYLGKTALSPVQERRLRMVRLAAERGAKLTAQLLAFSRRQRLEPRAVNLNAVVHDMTDMLRSTLGGTVALHVQLSADLWPALVDQTQIELVILDLAINARDAMTDGGELYVSTANVVLPAGQSRQPEEPGPGDYVAISVVDTGTGMTPEVRAKAFEPFFTTKDVGKGSGLGLPQVFGFAKQSGGGVGIDTEPGRGTHVTVYLPRTDASAAVDETQPPRIRARAGGTPRPRVLLVDDDDAVREVAAMMLDGLGYDVRHVADGAAALAAIRRDGAAIDVMVVDFAMPGMNGAELARQVDMLRPDLPILFLTGYADAAALTDVVDRQIISKPFREEELHAKLEATLATAKAGAAE